MPELIDAMQERVKLCRRLADATHDKNVSKQLRSMADAIEADLQRFEQGDRQANKQVGG